MYDLGSFLASDAAIERLRQQLVPANTDVGAAGASAPPLLRDAKIKITSRCNLRCEMCKYWRIEHEPQLPSETWRAVLTDLAQLGCRKVHFSGGEVFLRSDFLELVEHAIGCRLKTNLTTNGTLVDKERARRLINAGVNSVSVSLDAPEHGLHDRLRGRPGAFKKTVRAVEALTRYAARSRFKKRGKVRINCVAMRSNFRRLPEMVRFAGELGAVDLNPMPVDEKGERRNRLSRREIELYNRELAPRVQELRQHYGFSLDPIKIYPFGVTPEEIRYSKRGLYARGFYETAPCLAPWLHTFIGWNGTVSLCCMTNGRIEPLGTIAAQPLRDVLQGSAYERIRGAFAAGTTLPECQRCDLFLSENAQLHAALARRASSSSDHQPHTPAGDEDS
jgi:MoaA/NifB/PqqE/SkfB family radical SAM enzyme